MAWLRRFAAPVQLAALAQLTSALWGCSTAASVRTPPCDCQQASAHACQGVASSIPAPAAPSATATSESTLERTETLSIEGPAGGEAVALMDAPIYLELAAGGSIVGPVGFLRKGARVDAVLRSDLPDHIEVDTTFPQPLSWIISEADVAKAQ